MKLLMVGEIGAALVGCSSVSEPSEAEMRQVLEKRAAQDVFGPKKLTHFKKHKCDEFDPMKGMPKMPGIPDLKLYQCSFEMALNGGMPRATVASFQKGESGWSSSMF